MAEFCRDARVAVDDIAQAGKTPLLVGGTMLYFKALLEGMAEMPPADPEIRQQLEREAAIEGWPALHRRLQDVDPESARRIHPNHSQRLGRALEVFLSSGVPMSEWLRRQEAEETAFPGECFQLLQIALCPSPRSLLHARIERRVQLMLEAGLVQEVCGLYQRGDLHPDLPALRAVGYRQMWQHLQGEYDLEQAIERTVIATRQLAKRQLTWLRGWQGLSWIYTNESGYAANSPDIPAGCHETPLQLALKYLAVTTM